MSSFSLRLLICSFPSSNGILYWVCTVAVRVRVQRFRDSPESTMNRPQRRDHISAGFFFLNIRSSNFEGTDASKKRHYFLSCAFSISSAPTSLLRVCVCVWKHIIEVKIVQSFSLCSNLSYNSFSKLLLTQPKSVSLHTVLHPLQVPRITTVL